MDVGEVAHPGIGVGGRAGGVELGGGEDPIAIASLQFGGVDGFRQVGGHQRHEARGGLRPMACAQGGHDPIAVGLGLLHRRDRRLEIGHHDRTGELPRGVADHGLEHLPIAQVEMPVVRVRIVRVLLMPLFYSPGFDAQRPYSKGVSRGWFQVERLGPPETR